MAGKDCEGVGGQYREPLEAGTPELWDALAAWREAARAWCAAAGMELASDNPGVLGIILGGVLGGAGGARIGPGGVCLCIGVIKFQGRRTRPSCVEYQQQEANATGIIVLVANSVGIFENFANQKALSPFRSTFRILADFFKRDHAVADGVNAVRSRDGIVGAVFVLVVVTAQARWMGRASTLLSVGLVIAYLLWIAARWRNDPAAVLPMCLVAIAVQCLHFAEEYLAGFQRQFPKLMAYEWSGARFVAFNMAWLAVFVLAALGAYRRVALGYLVVLFLALGGGVGNGAGHLLLSATQGRYFPGLATAPLCLLAGIGLLIKMFGERAVTSDE